MTTATIIANTLNCTKKNGRLILEKYPEVDGIYNLKVYDEDLKRYSKDTYLASICGTRMTYILQGNDGGQGIAQENTACPITKTVMTTGVNTFQEALKDYLKTQSEEVADIFYTGFNVDIRVSAIPTTSKTDDENDTPKEPKYIPRIYTGRKHGKAMPPTLEENEKVTNGMVDLREYEDRFIVVKGHVQSGKTKFIISAATWFISQGKHVVIVLRNATDDKSQIAGRFDTFNQGLKAFLAKKKIMVNFDIEMIDSKKAKPHMFTTGLPKIFVCLGNNRALEDLNELIESEPLTHKRFVTFIDEVDYVYSEDTKVKDQLELLRSNTYATFAVSATVLDPLLKEKVQKGGLIFLKAPEGYVGLFNLHHRIIPEDSKYGTDSSDDIFECDPFLVTALHDFATSELTKTEHWNSWTNEWHPRYWLARITYTLDRIQQALSYMAVTYPECVSMSYTGNGKIIMYLPTKMPITLKNFSRSTFEKINYPGLGERTYHVFKNASPGLVVEWLHNNGGFKYYPRIIVFASKMAARSISFGASNYEECRRNGKLWYHLTAMYALLAPKNDQPEMLQCLGRLCVVKNDTIPLFLYTTDQVRKDLKNAYHLQEELIQRANDRIWKSKYANDTMSRILQDVSIWREKVPKRDLIKKEGDEEIRLKIVPDEETDLKRGGWNKKEKYVNVDEYGNELVVEDLVVEDDGNIDSSDDEELEEEGKYTVIDQSRVKKGTVIYNMIGDLTAILLENNKINIPVTLSWVIQQFKNTKYQDKSNDQIYGAFWTTVSRTKWDTTNTRRPHSLLTWKDNVNKIMLTN